MNPRNKIYKNLNILSALFSHLFLFWPSLKTKSVARPRLLYCMICSWWRLISLHIFINVLNSILKIFFLFKYYNLYIVRLLHFTIYYLYILYFLAWIIFHMCKLEYKYRNNFVKQFRWCGLYAGAAYLLNIKLFKAKFIRCGLSTRNYGT